MMLQLEPGAWLPSERTASGVEVPGKHWKFVGSVPVANGFLSCTPVGASPIIPTQGPKKVQTRSKSLFSTDPHVVWIGPRFLPAQSHLFGSPLGSVVGTATGGVP